MKSGFMQALEQTARTGVPPTPEPRPAQAEPMQPLHEQLLASLAAAAGTEAASPSTVPTAGTVRTGTVVPEATTSRPRTPGGRSGPVSVARKGTIEEILGLDDVRASDASRYEDDLSGPAEMQVTREVLGPPITEDFIADPAEAAIRAKADAVAEALGREVEVPLPSEEVAGAGEMQSSRVATMGTQNAPPPVVSPAAPVLTYDLPTDPDALPAFCFVCGPAGVGKTFQAKAWASFNPEGVVLAATTGIAAVNLGEGTTINSLLKYYDTASLADSFTGGWLESQLKRLRGTGLRRIVLDEVSMLDGDQLTILTRAIDNVNSDRGEDAPEMGLILVGDFAQLSPVKAPFAFESAEWDRYAQATHRLTTIRRQADKDFIEALQAVRRGDHHHALEFFGPRLEQTTAAGFEGTTILAKNEAVSKYNQLRLDKVPGKSLTFQSSRWGKLRPEWGGPPKPPAEWGVPEVLTLKIGALVMILANRNVAPQGEPPEFIYVNGDLGQVVDAEGSRATVVLQRTGEEVTVVPITRENTIPLEVGRRKQLREEGHPERISANGKSEVIGACSYLPLRLAYATTCHKSQGLSLDTVQLAIRDNFFSHPGMLYTALSRCRTAEGLRIVGSVESFRARCTVNEKVRPWLL